MKKVFVIIVTYKGQQWYDCCFASLRKSAIPVQTVVVDNTPEDDDAEYIKAHYPEVHVIKTNENLGFGRANNLGMRYALDNGCDYVFLLNQDAWIETDSIVKLVDIAEQHPEFAILSPMHMTKEMNHLNILINSERQNYELLSDAYCGTLKEYYQVNYVNAAAWLMPRKTIETIGGFDPIFYHYGEDDNYINRIKFHKMKIVLCPQIRIVHDHTTFGHLRTLEQRHQQNILVEMTDINKPDLIMIQMAHHMKSILLAIILFKYNEIHRNWEDLKFIYNNSKMIRVSRKNNIQLKPNWLYDA